MEVISSKHTVSVDVRHAARIMTSAIDAFRAVNPAMTTQLAYTFLLVVQEEGLGVSEYAQRIGIPRSVMSRHIADLGEYNRKHEKGLDLVVTKTDILDRRRSQVLLTPKGRAVAEQIRRALFGGIE